MRLTDCEAEGHPNVRRHAVYHRRGVCPCGEAMYERPPAGMVVDTESCTFGWGPGCDSYTGGHTCTRDGGHVGRHRCMCGATSVRGEPTASEDGAA